MFTYNIGRGKNIITKGGNGIISFLQKLSFNGLGPTFCKKILQLPPFAKYASPVMPPIILCLVCEFSPGSTKEVDKI